MRKTTIVGVLGVLASCAAPTRLHLTAEDVFDAITVERDDFSKTVMFDAPRGGEDRDLLDGARWFLRAVRSTEAPAVASFVLRFHRFSPEWCVYETAWTQAGKRLQIERTDSRVDAGPYSVTCRDYYSVRLSREDLEQAAREGMRIKLSGRRGDWVLGFPAYYAAGFLSKVDGKERPADQPAVAAPSK